MFKVYKKQIPIGLIDELLAEHQEFKRKKFNIFRAQGTTSFERPILNQYNNQINSIQNPHLLGFNKKFSKLIESIITHENISRSLSDFTGSQKHIWYQSMFFDNSTGTSLHQDTWYLDTNPNGKLCGVWIALEDIELESGPFCIYTNSDKEKIEHNEFNFLQLERDSSFIKKYPEAKRFDFIARKGDILIWDSFSIHGALTPADEKRTRKSITAHFYPEHLSPQVPPIKRYYSVYDHLKPITTSNIKILKATTINPFFYQAICTLMYSIKGLKKISQYIMPDPRSDTSEIRRLK